VFSTFQAFPCLPWFKNQSSFTGVTLFIRVHRWLGCGSLLLALEFETTSGTTELEIKKYPRTAFVCIGVHSWFLS
jgi:hypothetical protein